jgi:ABC-type sugar transport system substrate-binding protein
LRARPIADSSRQNRARTSAPAVPSDEQDGRPDGRLTIGFSQVVMNHPFRIANVESMKDAARDLGVALAVTDAEGDVDREIANIELLIDRGVDAIIVSSLSGEAIHPAYRKVADAGIPLIIFASGQPESDDTPYTSYVGTDEVAMGGRAADYIGERLGGEGSLVVINGVVTSTNSKLRRQGFMSQLERSWPNLTVLAERSADWLRRPAQQVMTELLRAHPRIEAVFAENDEMALGAVDALRKAHRTRDTLVVGLDGQKEALQAIRQGGPFAMTIRNEWDGRPALEMAVAAARGEPIPKRVVLDVPLIDERNVDEHFDPSLTF